MDDPTDDQGFSADAKLLARVARRVRSSTPRLGPGRVVADRYELRERLGAGGCGEVWCAKDRRLDTDVAVKFVDSPGGRHGRGALSFERESAALARIRAPGVVRLTDSGRDRGRQFLVLELVRGRNLAELLGELRAGRDPAAAPSPADLRRALGACCPAGAVDRIAGGSWFRTVTGLTVDVLRTLEAAHAAGVLHRDVKPSNIVLRPSGRPTLVDFGMASLRDAEPGFVTPNLFGTLPYLAPEQLASRRTGADARTDVYQVGLVLYELLALRPARPRASNACVQRIERPSSHVRAVPRALEDVCMRALESDPAQRYASASEFREELERWSDGLSPRASARGKLARACASLRRFARLRRSLLVALGGVLVGACLASAGRVEDASGVPPPPTRSNGPELRTDSPARTPHDFAARTRHRR